VIEPKPAALIYISNVGSPLPQHKHRLVDHRQQDAVDYKTWFVLRHDHLLAQTFGEHARTGGGIGGGREPWDHLDQPHHRDRIEEVQSNEPRRIG
jgi:hypothetical protein